MGGRHGGRLPVVVSVDQGGGAAGGVGVINVGDGRRGGACVLVARVLRRHRHVIVTGSGSVVGAWVVGGDALGRTHGAATAGGGEIRGALARKLMFPDQE